MSNRLAKETSPYLLQHTSNPLDWHPWGKQAFKHARQSTAFLEWLCALGSLLRLALSGDPTHPAFQALAACVHHRYAPGLVIASGKPGLEGTPPLLSGRSTRHGKPTAYLSQAFTCNLPTNSPEELTQQVEQAHGKNQA